MVAIRTTFLNIDSLFKYFATLCNHNYCLLVFDNFGSVEYYDDILHLRSNFYDSTHFKYPPKSYTKYTFLTISDLSSKQYNFTIYNLSSWKGYNFGKLASHLESFKSMFYCDTMLNLRLSLISTPNAHGDVDRCHRIRSVRFRYLE